MSQLISLDTAKKIAAAINAYGPFIGGGVLPYSPDPLTSGIFAADYGIMQQPGAGDVRLWQLRFANGNSTIIAGLVQDFMIYFPTSWPSHLALEVTPRPPAPWDLP